MKDLIYLTTILSSILYFAFGNVMGWKVEEGSSMGAYHMFVAVLDVLCVFFILRDRSRQKRKMSRHMGLTLMLLVTLLLAGIFEGESSNAYYLQFIALSIPAALIGAHFGGVHNVQNMYKWLDVIAIFLALSLISSFPRFVVSMLSADVYYSQSISYDAALTANMLLFLSGDSDHSNRFSFTTKKYYNILCYLLIAALTGIILFSGGRGGFLTLIAGLIAFVVTYHGSKRKLVLNGLTLSIVLIICSFVVFSNIESGVSELLDRSVGRIFSYISKGSIDVTETSGRDIIFSQAMALVDEKPVIGYGIFSYIRALGTYPHNIVVEWLLQGGYIMAILCVVFILGIMRKGIKIIQSNDSLRLLIPFFVFPFTELLFSGTWVSNPLFWFVVCFILNYNKDFYNLNKLQ